MAECDWIAEVLGRTATGWPAAGVELLDSEPDGLVEPFPSEPFPSEPFPSEPLSSEPLSSEPLSSEPLSSDFGASILPVGLEPESETRFRAHLDSCGACEALALEFERLDSLLSSEPVPLPPVDLTALILREVAARRRAELVWARSRLVAAAALVLTVGAIALLVGFDAPWGSGEWDLSLHAWDEVQLLLSRGRGQFDVLVGGTAPPSGLDSSLGPLLALGPVLLLLNWAVGRGSLQGTVT